MARYTLPTGAGASPDQYARHWNQVFAADPQMQAIAAELRATDPGGLGRTNPEFRRLYDALRARAAELGFQAPDEDWSVRWNAKEGVRAERAGFVDRNADWIGPLIVGGAIGGPFLAAALGGAGGGSAAAASSAGGGAASTVPRWVDPLVKGGAAAAIPALANQFGNGNANAFAEQASRFDDLIAGLLPTLQRQADLSTQRLEQSGPLYDAVLKMAMGRMPIWSK